MRDSSSSRESTGALWHRAKVWWPVECVPVILEVVHPRKLTALEWAVLRVMEAFEDDPPPMDEVAEELGIADKAFLEDTVRDVVRLRALTSSAEGWTDPSDLTFTSNGRELFRRGQIEGEPAEHGAVFYFDALTDEDLPKPRDLRDEVPDPFPPDGTPPTPREGVGLDRARNIVARFQADMLRGDGEITSVLPRPEEPSAVRWTGLDLELRITEAGALTPVGPTLGERRAVLEAVDAGSLLPTTNITEAWPEGQPMPMWTPGPFDAWRRRVQRTLPVDAVRAEVLRVLGLAKAQVFLHAGWWSDPAIQKKAQQVARAGAAVFVVGAEDSDVELMPGQRGGLVAQVPVSDAVPGAVVVDARTGVVVDRVQLRWGDAPVQVELGGVLLEAEASAAQQTLLQAVLGALPVPASAAVADPVLGLGGDTDTRAEELLREPTVATSVARLAASRSRADFSGCVAAAAAVAPGPERVVLLRQVGAIARRLAIELTEDAVREPAITAWRALLEQVDLLADSTALLVELAPDEALDDLVATAVERLDDSLEVTVQAEALLRLRELADRRWGPGRCHTVAVYRRRRDLLLGRADVERDTRVELATRLLDGDDLHSWASGEVAALQVPTDIEAFGGWVDAATPFLGLVGEQVRERAKGHVQSLLGGASSTGQVELIQAVGDLVEPEALLDMLLPGAPGPADVVDACARLRSAGVRPEERVVTERVRSTLPDPAAVPATATLVGTVRELGEMASDLPEITAIGRDWAERVVKALPPPHEAGALTWWLGELRPLLPLLSDPVRLAGPQLSRFARQLASDREQDGALWRQLVATWSELGLEESQLVGLLEATGRSDAQGGTGSKKRKKKKWRRR